MSYSYASGSNTFVPSELASGSLLFGYSKDINKFAVNRYTQRIPVAKKVFYINNWNSQQGDRITNNNLSLWSDGQDAPSGIDNTESFEFQPFRTQRRAYPFVLGEQSIEQASWNILAAQAAVAAQQAMTERTQLVYAAMNSAGFTSTTATAAGGGKFNAGTPTNPYLKNGLYATAKKINIATMGIVDVKDLCLVMNPNTALNIGSSQEITDNMKFVGGLTYVLDGVPVEVSQSAWGLPSRLYGFETIVEDCTVNTAAKGATANRSYVIPDGVIFMLSKVNGLDGIEGAQSWSTVQLYFYEEFTVESMYDVNNRLTRGRVVSDFSVNVPDQGVKSGQILTACI